MTQLLSFRLFVCVRRATFEILRIAFDPALEDFPPRYQLGLFFDVCFPGAGTGLAREGGMYGAGSPFSYDLEVQTLFEQEVRDCTKRVDAFLIRLLTSITISDLFWRLILWC